MRNNKLNITHLNFLWICYLWLNKQLTSKVIWPVLWNCVLGIKIFDNFVQTSMSFYKLNCTFRSYTFDAVTVITSKKNAQVNELQTKNNDNLQLANLGYDSDRIEKQNCSLHNNKEILNMYLLVIQFKAF